MAIKCKKKYHIYFTEGKVKYIRSFLDQTAHQGGLSGLLDSYLKTLCQALILIDFQPGKKVSSSDLLALFEKGGNIDPE